MLVQENVALAPLTTLHIGGLARFFVAADSIAAVQGAVRFAQANKLPLFVLGGGSNLVISDAGWPGLVLKIEVRGIEEHGGSGKVLLEVGAGEEWDGVVAHAVSKEYAGVECLSGIPGSAGGTPVQNVGAYGQEVSQTIDSVLTLDLRDGQIRELCREGCEFEYRTSIFNTSERGRFIILRVRYALTPGGEARIEYADLKKYFSGSGARPTLEQTRRAVREIRASKGMLIVPGDEDSRSAGSFFRNPVVSEAQFQELRKRASERGLQVPSYPALEAQKKISAAWLVEQSGFHKGCAFGRVGISRKHALAIVNRGGGTGAEIVGLKEHIQNTVQKTWGIALQPEPEFVGFSDNSQDKTRDADENY